MNKNTNLLSRSVLLCIKEEIKGGKQNNWLLLESQTYMRIRENVSYTYMSQKMRKQENTVSIQLPSFPLVDI